MRACPACGASNEATDDFCGNCGGYLGWSDAAPSPPAAADGGDRAAADPGAGTPGGAEAPAGRGTPEGPVTAEGSGTADGRRAAAPGAGPTVGRAQPADPGTVTGHGPERASAPGPDGARRTDGPTPPDEAPRPVKPAKAAAPRPVVRPVVAQDDTTGVPCPSCRALNPPHRRFCRRCAAPLAPVAAVAALPWWRTLWPLRRRVRGGSGRMARLLVILAVTVALCAGGFLLLPAGRHLIEDTRDKLGKAQAVTPAQVHATAELRGHPATDTTDGLSNRYWASPRSGASVTYTFESPFRLVDLIITNGASASAEEYGRQGRALRMTMEATVKGGQVRRQQLTLGDKPGPQTFPVGISDVTAISLTLEAPAGLSGGRHIALAEVEFFRRS
jgi:hypothetical protein